MSETITHTWQTVEQAAVTLNVSTRTVARRLASGSLESRVDENGRRLVLVQQINPAAVAEEAHDYGVDDSTLATFDPTPTPVVANSQAVTMLTVLQSTVTAARDDARAARRTAKWAWAGVGVMAVAILAGTAVVSSVVTKGSVTSDMLRTQLIDAKSELAQTRSELLATAKSEAKVTRDLVEAKRTSEQAALAAAAAEEKAKVAAAKVADAKPASLASAKTPATQPTLFGRVVSLFGDQ